MADLEYRFLDGALQNRSEDLENGALTGNVIQYGVLSEDLGGFRERFSPGSFKDILSREDLDVRLLHSHDTGSVLGRTPNTLQFIEDQQGLSFRASLPDTSLGRDTLTLIKRGDLTGTSLGFIPKEVSWDEVDGQVIRTIEEVSFFPEVSIVAFPAYSSNTVSPETQRSLDLYLRSKQPSQAKLARKEYLLVQAKRLNIGG